MSSRGSRRRLRPGRPTAADRAGGRQTRRGRTRTDRAAHPARRRTPPRRARADRAARGRRRLRVAIVTVALAGVAGVLWLLLGSSLLGVRQVEVAGAVELSAEQVRTAAAVPLGTPLLRLDTAAIESRVQQLGRVAGTEVGRSVTGTVHVAVTERAPIAIVPAADGVHLVDATATDFATVPAAPPGLPVLRVPRVAPGEPAARAAAQVLAALPPSLLPQVQVVTADSPANVVLRLDEGRHVRWGAPDRSARKAAVLGPLLTQPGRVYDVSSPQLPTIS
ncbi:MAG: FtsQ-type POTRA domain-containing protein [Pseudonocardiaceae bacterium]|nr:FtsQ-type POTRA domain-containing protein [Pseudonocardiaceae bacterium]